MVAPERVAGFLDRFAARHGALCVDAGPTRVVVTAADGAVAECTVPFPPLPPAADLAAHALRARRVAVLLVRRGGYAVAVADGSMLAASKVGSRHVQSRTAAGGWSQQRFARRREGQTRQAWGAAADTAAAVLLPHLPGLEWLVTGGDRRACDEVLADPRLAPVRALPIAVHLDVPDPRHRVLVEAVGRLRAVRVTVTEPDPPPDPDAAEPPPRA